MSTRVTTLSSHQSVLSEMMRSQQDLSKVHRQISSTFKSSTYQELSANGDAEKLISFESQIKSAENYITNNGVVESRLKLMNLHVGQLMNIATDIRNLFTTERSSSSKQISVEQTGKSKLLEIRGILNSSSEGRYIYSGSKIDTEPVGDILQKNVDDLGNVNFSYHKGDNQTTSTFVSNSFEMRYGVTAGDESFQKLIGAIHYGIQAEKEGDNAKMSKAVEIINSAMENLGKVRADINQNLGIIEKATKNHNDVKLFLSQITSDINSTDIPEATVELSYHQTVLQASYQTFARLSRLNLTEYL